MTKQRFGSAIGITVLTAALLTVIAGGSYAGNGSRSSSFRTLSSRSENPRAYLAPGSLDEPHVALDPLTHFGTSSLAYKVSFVGGLLLTADRVLRSMDSVMEATSFKSRDGSCFKLNAEPYSRGFLVGLTMSRPLDF